MPIPNFFQVLYSILWQFFFQAFLRPEFPGPGFQLSQRALADSRKLSKQTVLRHATRGTSTPYISRRLLLSHGQILGPGRGHTGSWQSERIYIELVSYDDVPRDSQRVLPLCCCILGRVMQPWHLQFAHVAPNQSANVQWMLTSSQCCSVKFDSGWGFRSKSQMRPRPVTSPSNRDP